jgi:hypothetical protein
VSRRIDLEQLIEVLEGDRELVYRLVEEGVIERRREGYGRREVEQVLVCRTLVRELDVNWAGVDIIVRMREELLATRRQVAELLDALQQQRQQHGDPER